ncbi:MAG: hypothetical protein L6408_06225, partial [Nanoarchaeota archaeon]|nr:hypothetical protein [Nanoarchaeota archaeon]
MKKSVILILMFVLIFCSFSVAKYDINIDYQKYLVKEANSEEVIADFLAFKNASKPLYEPKQRGLMALSSSSPPINIQIVIENTLEHHTYKYRPLEVYRRGARLHAKYALYNFDPEKHWFFVGVVGPGGYEFDDEFYEWTCRFSRSREVEECTYDLTIPPDAPVGTYIAYTYVHDIETGDRIFEWEREYYLIFNPFRSGSDVGGLGLSAIKAYAYSPYKGGKDETGIWFSPTIEYKPGILRKWRGADWGRKFALHPYDEDVFKEAISKIRGKTSSKDAAKRLREFTDSHLFSDPKKGQWDTDQLRDSGTHAQCASQANFLVEALRSVGIPSRPVFVDTNYGQSVRLAGEEKAWAFHTWTEIWFTDKWYALDAFISKNKDFYDTQTLGGLDGEDSPYGKQINDLILVAKPDWESSETTYSTDLVDADVQFVYNPEWALFYPYCSVPAQNIDRAGWIEELSQAYWNEPYWTSRECNTPKPYNITVTTDKERYRVGESMIVTVNVSSNLDVASNPLIHGEILEQIPFTKVPIEKTLYSFERSINLLPYGFNQFVEQYDVSEEVVATDFFNIVVNVENVSTITF